MASSVTTTPAESGPASTTSPTPLPTSHRPVHLVVAVHGLWGESRHLNSVCKALALRHAGIILKPEQLLDDEDDASSIKSKSKINNKAKAANVSKGQGPKDRAPAEPGASRESLTSTIHTKAEGQLDGDGKPKSRSWLKGLIDEPSSGEERGKDGHSIVILNTTSNHASNTYDGIDWLAERAALEVQASVKRMKELPDSEGGGNVVRVSVIGYSLGGLVCRYLVALLDSQGFFNSIEPVNFLTLATPHVGIPPGKGWFAHLAEYIGSRLLSRTGEQLYVHDSGWDAKSTASTHPANAPALSANKGNKGESSLLSAMAQPGSPFIKALARFPRVIFYSNALHDMTVPLRTGGLTEFDPMLTYGMERVQATLNPDYPTIVESIEVLPAEEDDTKLPLARRLGRSLRKARLPFLLDPKRYPFKPPLNYLAILALPVLFPILVVAIVHRFSSENRKSKKRIAELKREWARRNGSRSINGSARDADVESAGAKALREGEDEDIDHDRSRIEQMLRSVVRSVVEDRVSDVGADHPHGQAATSIKGGGTNGGALSAPSTSTIERPPTSNVPPPVTSTTISPPATSMELADQAKVLSPLRPCQEQMIGNLRNKELLPNLTTKLTWFEDVINSHAIIIARTPSMEMHRRGLPVLRHLADHFVV